jgi:hypothetical protein
MLVAYVDHQLDPAQRAAVDDIIREDLEARTIVSVLRGTGEAVRAAFEQPLHEAVPPRLLAALAAAGGGEATDTVVPIRRPVRFVRRQQLLTALAASIAVLFVGIGVGYLRFAPGPIFTEQGHESGPFEVTLYRALEREQVGAGLRYDDAASGRAGIVTVVGKVPSSLGDACREFRHDWTQGSGKGTETGLACRSATGDWSVLTVPREPAS